jgi:hypothetical protein
MEVSVRLCLHLCQLSRTVRCMCVVDGVLCVLYFVSLMVNELPLVWSISLLAAAGPYYGCVAPHI